MQLRQINLPNSLLFMVVGGDAVICVGLLIAYTVTVELSYTGDAREYVLIMACASVVAVLGRVMV